MAWYDSLPKEFLEIARTRRSPLRVMAGPGTGKTSALVNRITWLLTESKADPRRILLVTFTRVAAHDLQRELERLEAPNVRLVHAGTLHSLCFLTLNRAHVLGLTGRTPRPLLEFEERFLLEDLKSPDLGDYHERRRQLKAFEAAWAREQDQDPGWPKDPSDRVFQNLLYNWLRFHRAMLLGESVPETLRYLRENPQCRERRMFDHVLVDEYQDLNRAEQSLIDLLSENGKLTVVGDEDQSIYESFRYAHLQGIVQFDITHNGTYDVPLELCHRCPKHIVDMANTLIRNNARRTGRKLRTKPNAPYGEVHIVQWLDMEAEAEGLANFIHKKIASGEFEAGETLVLCPRRQFGYMIRDALNSRDVPAHSFFHQKELEGNPRKLNDSKSQEAFTLLTLLANPGDRVAPRCWLGFRHSDLRTKQYGRVREYCGASGRNPREVLDALTDGQLSIPYAGGVVDRYQLLRIRLQELKAKKGLELCNMLFPPEEEWAEAFCVLTEAFSQDSIPKQILSALLTSITQPELPADVDYVRVMSVHKSKGLTADNVVVCGCIQGLIPGLHADLSLQEQRIMMEEQGRLFFVAITRPKKTLVLSSVLYLPVDLAYRMGVTFRRRGGNLAQTIASQFIYELGPSRPDPVKGENWRY